MRSRSCWRRWTAAGEPGCDALVEPAVGRHLGIRLSPTCGSRGSGASGDCSRGGARRSSSPPTRSGGQGPRRRRSVSDPPDKAVVLSIDEKCQIQALDRTAPILPMRPGLPEKATHDYVRHGTTTFSRHWRSRPARSPTPATRGTARGVPALPQAGRQDLPAAEAAHRLRQLRHPETPKRAGLAATNPRITLHFTPTSGSWLNMVEIFFGIITRQAIRRGNFTRVKDSQKLNRPPETPPFRTPWESRFNPNGNRSSVSLRPWRCLTLRFTPVFKVGAVDDTDLAAGSKSQSTLLPGAGARSGTATRISFRREPARAGKRVVGGVGDH